MHFTCPKKWPHYVRPFKKSFVIFESAEEVIKQNTKRGKKEQEIQEMKVKLEKLEKELEEMK